MGNGKRAGKHRNNRLADMSLPAEERNPRKGTRTSRKPKPAQLQHGNSTWGRARARDGERLMERDRDPAPQRDLTSATHDRHAAAVNTRTGPERSLVSRTATVAAAWPTSAQLPLAKLWLDFRQLSIRP